ncbi:Hypothetical protein GbCGDNIH1_0774 [Granulibacter bethesdensis CGDNIH1]|uniref:ATP-grasp domain-containing protein n=2 Tax=Granulibacter bethesdensis TaxID=364410 RepID=Q0BU30_GRABC|nr:Hypothetical protein GbCGDNIH1_0774 [Granulibacter bethesdensis CGDNIH1]APH51478.1 Hypothetical protein GbCGDNIH5_0774 [Granulibacter bethesdensis]APH64171.1 Hypothetical protein GbCGDNIH1I4_0774 [Granulibacter bethesdensis]
MRSLPPADLRRAGTTGSADMATEAAKPGSPVLIIAFSGRALASAARREGLVPLVCDLFGDSDTIALAEQHTLLPFRPDHGIDAHALACMLDTLCAGKTHPLIWGSGFEDQTSVLESLQKHHPLQGTPPPRIADLKNPLFLATLCREYAVPFPAISLSPPPREAFTDHSWLTKRIGGSGGSHIHPVRGPGSAKPGRYYQQHVKGIPISALMLGRPMHAPLLIGWSRQWTAPSPCTPFRFGGAARLTERENGRLSPALQHAALDLTRASGLVGLGSLDFLVHEDGFHLLEINPRPGATLDVFPEQPLITLHMLASGGTIPEPVISLASMAGSRACAVAYAPRSIKIPEDFVWPDWTADHSRTHTLIPRGAPVCTVLTEAADATSAKALAEDRTNEILQRLETSS